MIPSSEGAKIILTHLLQIGVYSLVIFGAILAFGRIFGSKARPALRFGLWFLLLLRLSVPFTLASTVHLIVLPAAESAFVPQEPQAEAAPRPASPTMASATLTPVDGASRTPVPAKTMHPAQRAAIARPSIWQCLLVVWIAGAAALLLRRLWMRRLLSIRLRTDARVPDPEILREFQRLCQQLRIRRPVRILEMEDVASPALTIGLRPTVLLPSSLAAKDQKQERQLALLHELTHLKRGDHLTMLWYGALRCLWWFHPVVWLMEKPFRLDLESACDAKAVKGMSREEKLAYASLLLKLSGKQSL